MIGFVLLAAVITTEGTQQAWIDQLRQADRLRNETRYEEAERAYIVARQQAGTLGADELPMAITLNHIGSQYQMLGRLREAERSYAAALAIFDRKFGAASHNTIRSVIDLSSVYLEMERFSQAESLIRRFLSRSDELSPEDWAILLADLASVLSCQRKYEDAEPLYRQALPLFEKDPSQESRERTIITLSNLSTICMHRARFAEGRIFSDRARALLGMLADPQPLMVLKTMANASAVSVKTGNPTETDSLFQSVIAFCQNNFGPNHYLLGHIMRNYAEFLRTVHRSADARAAKRRSKAILESFSKDNLLGHTVDATAFR